VHDLALWQGVLAFGFGLVLGMSFDTVPALEPAVAPVAQARPAAANEPVTAERREVGAPGSGRPREVVVGPHGRRRGRRAPSAMD
jgi:hypothetical protein